jgi:hypothetical protein
VVTTRANPAADWVTPEDAPQRGEVMGEAHDAAALAEAMTRATEPASVEAAGEGAASVRDRVGVSRCAADLIALLREAAAARANGR